jgi:hypothetical protein
MASNRKIQIGGDPKRQKGTLALTVQYSPSGLKVKETPFGVVLDLQDAHVHGEPGTPGIPSQRVRVALPPGSTVKSFAVKVGKRAAMTKGPVFIAPIQEPQPAAPAARPGKTQLKRSLFSKPVVEEEPQPGLPGGRGITPPRLAEYERLLSSPPPVARVAAVEERGGATVVTLDLHPVAQSRKGIVELATQVVVSLTYEPTSGTTTSGASFRQPHSPAEARRLTALLRAQVLNPTWVGDLGTTWTAYFPVDYLVITDNQAWDAATSSPVAGSAATVGDMATAFQRLCQWKKRRGLSTRVVTVTDIVNGVYGDFKTGTRDLQEVLRNFLKWAYDEWSIAWVLLGGDDNVVPVRQAAADGCGSIEVGSVVPPADNHSFWTGTFLKMHVVGDSHSWWPGDPTHETLVNPASGTIIPFDGAGTSDAAHPGWYFTTDDTYATRSVAATKFLHVNGPASLVNANLRWLYTWNVIPTDLYYSSLVGPSYGLPGLHDWDMTNNGIYGQYSGGTDLDGVKLGADVGIGRAPVGTAAEAGIFVDKVLSYEKLRKPDGTALDLNWARRLTVVSDNFGRDPWISKTTSNPPGENSYHHGAGDAYSLIHLKDVFSNLDRHLFVQVTDTDVRVMPYTAEAQVLGRGYYFAVSDSDLTPSEQIISFFGGVIRIALPTEWVVVYGESDEREPAYFIVNPLDPDSSMTDQETLRKQITADFPGVDVVKRLYRDEVDLPAADVASPPLAHLTKARVQDALNLGPHFLCLSGHGSQGGCCYVNGTAAQSATNGFLEPVTYAASCLTADFTNNEAASEKLLQNPNGGAVAYVGYTRFGWIGSGGDFACKFFDTLQTTRHLALLNDSRFDLTWDRWTIYAQTLLGDPEMPVWVGKPREMKVTHPAEIVKQHQSLVVTVKTDTNVALQHAMVVLTMGDSWVRSAETNAAGAAHFDFTPPNTGTLEVTVTAVDRVPYFGSITVKPKPLCLPYVVCGTDVTCKASIICKTSVGCLPSILCKASLHCTSSVVCKTDIICGMKIAACGVAVECGAAVACMAGVGGGCPAIDPVDFDDFLDILEACHVGSVSELARKVNTPEVKAVLARLQPANRKALLLMLKRIAGA